jgi:hypothetical protein
MGGKIMNTLWVEKIKQVMMNDKKWLLILFTAGILLMLIPGIWGQKRSFFPGGSLEITEAASEKQADREEISYMEETLALDTQRILSKIRGAGTVYVTVTLEGGIDREFTETPRETQIARERAPVLKGVLVVAEGAGDKRIQRALSRAVQSLFGIAPHQIMVVEGERLEGERTEAR